MLEPQRLLSRLNTITVDWQNTIAMTGTVLRAEDIAASLAGLERGPYLLLRYLWCQDESVKIELYGLFLSEIIQIADKSNWQCKNDFQRLMALIKMAIHELKGVNLCKRCKGSGVNTNQPCNHCEGRGKKRISQAEYARYCGVKPTNWQRSWAHKYQEVFLFINEWNELGMSHVLSRL